MQYYPPYWLDETAKRFQDGDGQELNATGDIAPLRHLVNVAATSSPKHTTRTYLSPSQRSRGRVGMMPTICKGERIVQRFKRCLSYTAFKEFGPF